MQLRPPFLALPSCTIVLSLACLGTTCVSHPERMAYAGNTAIVQWPPNVPQGRGMQTLRASVERLPSLEATADLAVTVGLQALIEDPTLERAQRLMEEAVKPARTKRWQDAVELAEPLGVVAIAADPSTIPIERGGPILLYLGHAHPLVDQRAQALERLVQVQLEREDDTPLSEPTIRALDRLVEVAVGVNSREPLTIYQTQALATLSYRHTILDRARLAVRSGAETEAQTKEYLRRLEQMLRNTAEKKKNHAADTRTLQRLADDVAHLQLPPSIFAGASK